MNIHFIGCEGAGMRALSCIMRSAGHSVTGSDIALAGHDAANVQNAHAVVYTNAVGEDNGELTYARALGIPVYERAQFLGVTAARYKSAVCVCGSHGKTTATGFCAEVFKSRNPVLHMGGAARGGELCINGGVCGGDLCAGGDGGAAKKSTRGNGGEAKKPTYGNGGAKKFARAGGNGAAQNNGLFICESCEYRRGFLHLYPDIALVLNIELDHTDYYKDFDDYFSAFARFAAQSKFLILNGDDPACKRLYRAGESATFGLSPDCGFYAADIQKEPGGAYGFSLMYKGRREFAVTLRVEGRHNIYNALAAAAAGKVFGQSADEIKRGLAEFSGVRRRFEYLGGFNGSSVFSDYAHHPSELAACIATAKNRADKVIIIFEPHTYSRTASLADGFAESLSAADLVYILPVFAAREAPIPGVTSLNIVSAIQKSGGRAEYMPSYADVFSALRNLRPSNAAIVFAGAGSIDNAAREFAAQYCG
ncbi:MAG: UDP-N-acetylmuramate--L-alanine ligase [Clostridiales bacterium]|jgi:UDP-N-acetylmuramate--alanine ligase|nr:UDP-N-acetylmuramate--L-alanine ligase [Clostridiales bacterium]